MKKLFLAILALILILSAAGCEGKPTGGESTDMELFSTLPLESQNPTPTGAETPDSSPAPATADPAADRAAAALFRSFLDDNYDKLMELSFKYIVGIGFIDLNLDGVREMILFDAGASASLGVEIFEVFNGAVRCVTANIAGLSEAFGGTSDIVINANFFEDFRLLENTATGNRAFVVESKNGNIEEFYSDLIRFGTGADGGLTLTSLFYMYEEYDAETGETTFSKYKAGDTETDIANYAKAWDAFNRENTDLNLECRGVFIWENSEYTESRKSFMETADKALDLYESNRVS